MRKAFILKGYFHGGRHWEAVAIIHARTVHDAAKTLHGSVEVGDNDRNPIQKNGVAYFYRGAKTLTLVAQATVALTKRPATHRRRAVNEERVALSEVYTDFILEELPVLRAAPRARSRPTRARRPALRKAVAA